MLRRQILDLHSHLGLLVARPRAARAARVGSDRQAAMAFEEISSAFHNGSHSVNLVRAMNAVTNGAASESTARKIASIARSDP